METRSMKKYRLSFDVDKTPLPEEDKSKCSFKYCIGGAEHAVTVCQYHLEAIGCDTEDHKEGSMSPYYGNNEGNDEVRFESKGQPTVKVCKQTLHGCCFILNNALENSEDNGFKHAAIIFLQKINELLKEEGKKKEGRKVTIEAEEAEKIIAALRSLDTLSVVKSLVHNGNLHLYAVSYVESLNEITCMLENFRHNDVSAFI